MNVVELDNLSRRYGVRYALTGIRLEISAGKMVVLKGSNGAGKTTLLRVLSTGLRPSKGSGRVCGFDLIREAAEVRKHVALLTVMGGSYGSLTALENLTLAAKLSYKPDRPEGLVGLLAQVGLAQVRDQQVRTFSSGMKKRLGIARLLLADCPLWLLDEPYAALDADGKALIDTLLLRAKEEGKTVVMASHELERSVRFADAVLEIEGGRLVATKRPQAESVHLQEALVAGG